MRLTNQRGAAHDMALAAAVVAQRLRGLITAIQSMVITAQETPDNMRLAVLQEVAPEERQKETVKTQRFMALAAAVAVTITQEEKGIKESSLFGAPEVDITCLSARAAGASSPYRERHHHPAISARF